MIERDLAKIRQLAEEKRDENRRKKCGVEAEELDEVASG